MNNPMVNWFVRRSKLYRALQANAARSAATIARLSDEALRRELLIGALQGELLISGKGGRRRKVA